MARPIRMEDLEAKIRWQADQERATLRHTSADVRREANDSIQAFREMISDNGHPLFLTSYSGSMTPGNVTSPQDSSIEFEWGLIDISSIEPEVQVVYGVDVHYNGETQKLFPVSFAERNDYDDQGVIGVPTRFFLYDRTNIAVMPPPSSAHKYTIWYLPLLPDLTKDDDKFDPVVPGAEKWVVWDVMVKLLYRDNYPDLYQAAISERQRLAVDILHKANKRQRAGAAYRLDTRGRRRTAAARMYYGGWWT